jgi:uncharacterized protein (DUF362 family)
MILHVEQIEHLQVALDKIGLGSAARENGSVLLKINLSHPPEPEHPRTDPTLLTHVIQYIVWHDASCAIAEGANGFLEENVAHIGLSKVIKKYGVQLLDLDLEETDAITVDDEMHYLPKCLKEYAVRVGIPAISKRSNMIFSNNVKLFVGVVPRKMYQIGKPQSHRPRIHLDLHKSVANIYRAVTTYAPFDFFVNGGKIVIEGREEGNLGEILVGDGAIELDHYVLKKFNVAPPEYIRRLEQ